MASLQYLRSKLSLLTMVMTVPCRLLSTYLMATCLHIQHIITFLYKTSIEHIQSVRCNALC